MVTPGNREGERERDREAEKEERIFCYARREKISGGDVRVCVRIGGPFDCENRSQPCEACTNLGRSERGREKRREEEGCGEKEDGDERRRWWLVITRKNEIYRSSVHRRSDYPRRICYLRWRLSPEEETLSLEQAARPTGEKKKKKSFGCSPWMTSGGDFSTRIPLFSPRNNRLVFARPTR